MTIAACYRSAEGIVLGADSTATRTYPLQPHQHYFNYNQKIFEVGNDSDIGILTWGAAAAIPGTSYRTLVARLADDLRENPASSVDAVARRWADVFWTEYSAALAPQIKRAGDLSAKGAIRTHDEVKEFEQVLPTLCAVGFCVGGYCPSEDHKPSAFWMSFDPRFPKPSPLEVNLNYPMFWGVQSLIQRTLLGIDPELLAEIARAGLFPSIGPLLSKYQLFQGVTDLPLRDAIDFVYSSIYSTIKAVKFSTIPQVCGGPIEVAVISSDRHFRWVRHKRLDESISEQER